MPTQPPSRDTEYTAPQTDYSDGEKAIGIRRTAAFALEVGMEAVRRSTLRALLPKGETKLRGPVARERWHLGDRNGLWQEQKTSVRFGQTSKIFECAALGRTHPGEAVIVRDRSARSPTPSSSRQSPRTCSTSRARSRSPYRPPTSPRHHRPRAARTAARRDQGPAVPAACTRGLEPARDHDQQPRAH